MKSATKELVYVISLTVISLGVSKFVWLLPIILFLPIVLTYTVDSPLVYLVVLGIVAELFALLPPGLMFAVIFLPWIIFKILRKAQVNMSFFFGLTIMLTILLQVGLVYSPDIYMAKDILVIPWLKIIPIILFTSTVAMLTSVAIYFNRSV